MANKPKEPNVRMEITLPLSMKQSLEAMSEYDFRSVSSIVRAAVARFLERK